MDLESPTPRETALKGSTSRIKEKDLEFIFGLMEKGMKGSGLTVQGMALEFSTGMMVVSIKVNGLKGVEKE